MDTTEIDDGLTLKHFLKPRKPSKTTTLKVNLYVPNDFMEQFNGIKTGMAARGYALPKDDLEVFLTRAFKRYVNRLAADVRRLDEEEGAAGVGEDRANDGASVPLAEASAAAQEQASDAGGAAVVALKLAPKPRLLTSEGTELGRPADDGAEEGAGGPLNAHAPAPRSRSKAAKGSPTRPRSRTRPGS